MLPDLKKGADGSLTLYVKNKEPTDAVQKANWLPAPDGPIYMVMRLYWPKDEALNGTWSPPKITRVEWNCRSTAGSDPLLDGGRPRWRTFGGGAARAARLLGGLGSRHGICSLPRV